MNFASKGQILVVEDEVNFARYLQLELENEGFTADISHNGETGVQMAIDKEYDVILLDVMLPKFSGTEVCRRIREVKDTPIIMLSARSEIPDKVSGLDSGANDYMTKPFAIEELFARIRVYMRQKQKNDVQQLVLDTIIIQPHTRQVFRDEREIALTSREFDLLLYLMTHKGQILSREQLLNAVWGYEFDGISNVVDVYIAYLRQKIDTPDSVKLIHTVRGVGFTIRV
jgi:two-component system response regulator ArlR